jgi:hypothetical protein
VGAGKNDKIHKKKSKRNDNIDEKSVKKFRGYLQE